MVGRKLVLGAALLGALMLGTVGCGHQAVSLGSQTFVLTSVAPAAVPGLLPTAIVITGSDFSNAVGTAVEVTFRADAGMGTPFSGGNAREETVEGTITSSTTIATTTPIATICGPALITASIKVTMPSGVVASSGTGFITFLAPVLATVVTPLGGGLLDAAVPDPVTITGMNFGDIGGTVDVSWRSTPPGAGPLLFEAGSSMVTRTTGTVVSPTTITTTSPLALVCGPAITALPAQIFRIDFRDGGSCTPTAGPFLAVSFRAPRITAVTNTGVAPYLGTTGPAMFAAAIPEPYTITGTGFGPVGGTVEIDWTSAAGTTIYNTATSSTTSVTGTIMSRTMITATAHPAAAVCTVAADPQNLMVTMPDAACSPSTIDGLGAATQIGPTVTVVANLDRPGGTTSGSGASFFGSIPETFQITGTDFGPVGGTALVTLTETVAAPNATPFAAGTSPTVTVLATITSRTTMQGTTPLATYVGADVGNPAATPCQFGSGAPTWVALLEGGSCNVAPLAPGTTFDGPVGTTGVAPTSVVSTIRLGQSSPDTFTFTGLGFAPVGGQATVLFDDPGTAMFDGGLDGATVTGTIVSETTITGTLPTITAGVPSVRLAADLAARVVVTLPGARGATNCPQDVTFSAPPTILTIANASAGAAAPSFLATIPGTDYIPCHNSTMSITGTGFDLAGAPSETELSLYDLVSGVGPAPGVVPVRRLGTATPVGNDLGDAAAYTAGLTATTISARIRLEPSLDDLDGDRNGLVTARVRVLNADGQWHATGAAAPLDPVFRTTSPAINVGTGAGANQDNTSVAIDPSSFTTDFSPPLAVGNDTVTPGINMAVAAGADDPGLFPGFFASTDALVARSIDGGATWVSGAAGLAAIEGAPLPPPVGDETRAFFHIEYDTFGNLWMCYLRSAPTVGQDDIVLVTSVDNGATWAQFAVVASSAPLAPFGVGTLDGPHMAVGPDGTGVEKLTIAWIDNTGLVAPWSVATVADVPVVGFGLPAGVFGPVPVSDTLAPPPAFFLLDAKAAVGPAGETYVGWQEPDAAFTTVTFRFDADRDGVAFGNFAFNPGPDVGIATVSLPGVGLPSQPDIGFVPLTDIAVAQAGTNVGRIVYAYDRIVPAAGGGTRDHAQVVTHVSDTHGGTWSGGVVPHALDQSDRYIPAVTSDRGTGRFHITWYDTTPSGGFLGPNTTFDRRAAGSNDGVAWGTDRNLFAPRTPAAHMLNGNNDHGRFADVVAFRGCVLSGWSDPADTGGATNDPVVTVFSQNDK
jgi:hypothetical protein